jgi:LuxR family maltose regulon positive regulatory protein
MKRSNPQSDALTTLLTTSLRIPQLHGAFMTRSILIEKMDQALRYPLTLISAPAGFGKTTLLSQWILGSHHQSLQNRVAWVSLENECDLRKFWTYILTAIAQIQPGICVSAMALLNHLSRLFTPF